MEDIRSKEIVCEGSCLFLKLSPEDVLIYFREREREGRERERNIEVREKHQ